ncbi:MAG: cache domain-containing protein [Alphaproteobacteria bacterium]|nr:cache domain-containing protein [Alphaproteobacteria bacterium]
MLNRLKVAPKIYLLVTLSVIGLVALSVFAAVLETRTLTQSRVTELKSVIDSVESIMADIDSRDLTREEKLDTFRAVVQPLRFRGNEYIFAYLSDGTGIAHGAKPALIGKNLWDVQDPTGLFLLREIVKVAKADPAGGVVQYMWPKGQSETPVPKTSYVKRFAPWDITIGTGIYDDDLQAELMDIYRDLAIGVAIVLVALVGLGIAISRNISGPLARVTAAINRLADNDLDIEVVDDHRRDELGVMASALSVFREKLAENERLRRQQEEGKAEMERARRDTLRRTAEDFEKSVGVVVGSVLSAAEELKDNSDELANSAAHGTDRTKAASIAVQESSQNVTTVASASDELTSSIQEISRQLVESATVAQKAADEMEETTVSVAKLDGLAAEIGGIIQLINDIAEQTNLLALNATIEAARAGDAGKGFAVVATEVKSLATQTATATDQIASQIEMMQQSTASTSKAISAARETVARINEISGNIASAVEQQTSATQEIASNANAAASGAADVARNLTDVQAVAGQVGDMAGSLKSAAERLVGQSQGLKQDVAGFIADLGRERA